MTANLRWAVLKIERANKHISDMKEAFRSLEETCTSTVQQNPDTRIQELVHTIPSLESSLQNISLIVGDAVHNLRSALDIAWYNTILRLLPDKVSPKTKFPVRKKREEVESALHGIEVDTRCRHLFDFIVLQVQPYEGGHNSVVLTLHDLDIADKHIIALELTPHAHVRGISMKDEDGQIYRGNSMSVQGAGPYTIPFEGHMELQDKGKLSVAVTLKDAGVFEGVPILSLLPMFFNYSHYVVKVLEEI